MSAATSRRGSQVSDSLHLEQEGGEARLRAVSLSDGVIGRTLMIDNPRIRCVQHISILELSTSLHEVSLYTMTLTGRAASRPGAPPARPPATAAAPWSATSPPMTPPSHPWSSGTITSTFSEYRQPFDLFHNGTSNRSFHLYFA